MPSRLTPSVQFMRILTEESGEVRGLSGEERGRFESPDPIYGLLTEMEGLRLEESSRHL